MSLPAAGSEGNTQYVPKGESLSSKGKYRALLSTCKIKLHQPAHPALSCRDVGKEAWRSHASSRSDGAKVGFKPRQPGSTVKGGVPP